MGNTIQKRGCHLCIAKDGNPFPKLQVCCDDDAGFLIEFADQMEQQRAAGFWERDIPQLVDDHAVQRRQLPDNLPGIALGLLFDQSVDQKTTNLQH